VNISHLRMFVAIAEELSLRRAAERLYMSSSPLSRMLKEFERELGVVLFDRSTRQVQLTEAGARALPHVREIIERIDALPKVVRDSAQVGELQVGLVHGVHPVPRDMLPRALRQVVPHVAMDSSVSTSQLENLLLHGELDIAVLHAPIASQTLDFVPLYFERLSYAAVAIDHPLAAKEELSMADLLGYSFVVYKQVPMSHFLRSLLQYLRQAGVHDVRFTQDNDVCAFVNTIVDGRGFGLLSDDEENPIRKTFAGDRSVRLLPIVDMDFPVVTVAAWSKDGAESDPLIRAASDAISKMKGCGAVRGSVHGSRVA
jgi:DNA-binding transcriptional LysR family regulator